MQQLIEDRGLSGEWDVDSAGTGSYHVGELAHEGSRKVARERGIELTGRSRPLVSADIERFDWLIAMDSSNLSGIRRLDPTGSKSERSVLLLDYMRGDGPREVPDPYYVGGFDVVYDLILDGCEGLLEHILEQG